MYTPQNIYQNNYSPPQAKKFDISRSQNDFFLNKTWKSTGKSFFEREISKFFACGGLYGGIYTEYIQLYITMVFNEANYFRNLWHWDFTYIYMIFFALKNHIFCVLSSPNTIPWWIYAAARLLTPSELGDSSSDCQYFLDLLMIFRWFLMIFMIFCMIFAYLAARFAIMDGFWTVSTHKMSYLRAQTELEALPRHKSFGKYPYGMVEHKIYDFWNRKISYICS